MKKGHETKIFPDKNDGLRTSKKFLAVLICILAFALLIFVFESFGLFQKSQQKQKIQSDPCFCKWKNKHFNFCYKMPSYPYLEGEAFSCDFLPILEELNLLEPSNDKFEDSYPTLITAFSSSHYQNGINMISAYKTILDQAPIIVYDLGLHPNHKKTLSNICNMIVEDFPFEKLPKYFKNLHHYRWKPIVIALAIQKYGPIIYADSSVIFKNSNFLRIPIKKEFESNQNSPYLLHSFTGHSVFSATMNSIYNYLPTNPEYMKSVPMYEAGLVYAIPSELTSEILKWYVLCALEEFCMVPTTDRPIHYCHNLSIYEPPICHRFDQSAINVILTNAFSFNSDQYVSGRVDFFKIQRNGRNPRNIVLKSC